MCEKYKTEMCKKIEETGSCPYGRKCKYAHSKEELRSKEVVDNYRTVECTKFKEGYCPYGDRCNFIHPKPKKTCRLHFFVTLCT